jgi:pSer/pThr/pTyr-binding forkhead associated (FHA) protein
MVDVGGKLYSIFDFKRPKNQNYIIIEVLGMPVGKNFSVIKIPDNYIIEVGRSGSELNIPDVSVSKKQATLKYDLSINELVLTDINSKYGTHILIQRPIELKLNHPMYFLNGLSLIQLNLKRI